MKKLWLILMLLLCLTACSKEAPVAPNPDETVQQPAAEEQQPEEQTPAEQPSEVQKPVADEPAVPQEEQQPAEQPEENPEKQPEQKPMTDAEIEAVLKEKAEQLAKDPSKLTPEQQAWVEMMQNAEFINEGSGSSSGNGSSGSQPQAPVQVTHTREETKAVLRDVAAEFKSKPDFHTLSEEAARYLDVNLDTVRNNPESSKTLLTGMESYECGSFTEEMLVFWVESWLAAAGPYGSQTITVQ